MQTKYNKLLIITSKYILFTSVNYYERGKIDAIFSRKRGMLYNSNYGALNCDAPKSSCSKNSRYPGLTAAAIC
jgi:hypothetical protein